VAAGALPGRPGGRAGLGAGLAFLRHDRLLLSLILTCTAVQFLVTPLFVVVLPVQLYRQFGSAVPLGLLLGGAGVGTLLGGALLSVVAARLPRRRLFVGAFLVGIGPWWALAGALPLPLLVGAMALLGLAFAPLNLVLITLIQGRVPAALRGRVLGSLMALSAAAVPLGILVSGYLADVVGVQRLLPGMAGVYTLVALGVAMNPWFGNMEDGAR